jgi:hypothetical protein
LLRLSAILDLLEAIADLAVWYQILKSFIGLIFRSAA